jgi:hypothetical protein
MVDVTDRAKTGLKSALSRSVEEPGVGLRVEVSEEGACALFPDREKAGDQVSSTKATCCCSSARKPHSRSTVPPSIWRRRRRALGWS